MLGVSVVIPCYNAGKFIRATLDSVLAQDYGGPLEVLVADDGSDDGSREIIASFGAPVRLLAKAPDENRSASCARNRCLRAATQPLVAFLDADDLWLPGHLAALADEMQRRPELGLVYDKGYFGYADGAIGSPILAEPHCPRVTPDDLLLDQCFPPAGVMVRSSALASAGSFDTTLPHAEDHDMWLRILEIFPAAHVPHFGFLYRIHEGQKSLRPALWRSVDQVLAKARVRFPYRRDSIRRRKAVIAYRFGEIAIRERHYADAAWQFVAAGCLDPARAAQEVWRRMVRSKGDSGI
jgi:glycosyltransferase involved in cell wall biosynthesis